MSDQNKDDTSGEAYSKNLGLFYNEPTDVGLDGYHFMDYPSISSEDGDIIEFTIPNSSGYYIDLRRTRITLRCQILQGDSTVVPKTETRTKTVEGEDVEYEHIPDESRVCVTNLFIASVFRQCQVSLNNVNFSPYVSTNYAYKGFLDTIFFSNEIERRTELRGGLWIKDDYEWVKDTDPFTSQNRALYNRHLYCRDSKRFSVTGKIYSDLYNIPKFLLSNIEMNIKFWKNNPSFSLVSSRTDSPSYRIKIHEAKVMVCYVHPSPSLLLAQAKLLKDHDVVYNYDSSIIKTVSLSTGDRSHVVNNCFSGDIPTVLIVGLVKTEAYMGNYNENPFVFLPFNLSFIGYSIDGSYVPYGPLQPKFKSDHYEDSDCAQAYSMLFSGCLSPDISREEYVESLNLYLFEVSRVRKGTKKIQKRGFSRLTIDFSEALSYPTTLIMYGVFPSTFTVSESRNVRI